MDAVLLQVQQIGRSLFLPVKNHMERLVDGTVVCQGYQQTLHKVEAGLTVAMDLSFTTFIEEMGAVEYMIAIAGASDAEDLLQKIHHTPGILKELGKAIR